MQLNFVRFQKMTANEDRRSKEKLQQDIQGLKNWIDKQPHLPHDIDKEILTAFVHGTKSLDIAIRKLESFITYRAKIPQLFGFSARDPLTEKFKEVATSLKMFILPQPTAERYRVLHIVSNDLSKYEFNTNMARISMFIELLLKLDCELKGLVMFIDLKGQTKTVWTKIRPMQAINLMKWLQTAMPMMVKRVVLYNSDSLTYFFINILKPFIAPKLLDRLRVTKKDVSVLKSYIEEEKLPSDYGGKELSSDELHDEWMNIIIQHREWFKRTSEWIPDETKQADRVQLKENLFQTNRRLNNQQSF